MTSEGTNLPDIPACLRIPQAERDAAWKNRKLTKPRAGRQPTKVEEAATRALRKQIEAQARAKAKAKAEDRKIKRLAEKRTRPKKVSKP